MVAARRVGERGASRRNRGRRAGGKSGAGPAGRLARWVVGGLIAAGVALGLWALSSPGAKEGPAPPATPPASDRAGEAAAVSDEVDDLVVEVVAAYPHDPTAYTQGLVWENGGFFESDGRYGGSTLRRVDLETGEVRRRVELPAEIFAEGLALAPPAAGGGPARLIQLTWREGEAMVWAAAGFERLGTLHYQGEGWGLCYDGRRLVMSDGSADLTFRDPADFAATGLVRVTLRGQPVRGLNELECVGGAVWANVYTTSTIVRIDPDSGRVTAVVDASGLLTAEEAATAEVLNGIAYDAGRDLFYVTGKNWPKVFAVKFVPRPTSKQPGG